MCSCITESCKSILWSLETSRPGNPLGCDRQEEKAEPEKLKSDLQESNTEGKWECVITKLVKGRQRHMSFTSVCDSVAAATPFTHGSPRAT